MISHMLEVNDSRIVSGFQIPEDNIFVEQGYFNESGLIENIAQTVALYTSYSDYLNKKKSPVGYIGSISNVVVSELPKSGTFISTEVIVITAFMGVTLIQGLVRQNGQELISLKMKTVLADRVPNN